jgi:hypothetical protein
MRGVCSTTFVLLGAAVMHRFAPLAAALAFCACDKVDFIKIEPETVVFKQANNEVWLSGKAMNHQGRRSERANIAWSVADTGIATINDKGLLKPVKSGHTEVIARYQTIEARAGVDVLFVEKIEVFPNEVTVVEGGDAVELKVKAFDYLKREIKDRTPTFKSNDPKTVSMGQNAVFGLAPGEGSVEVQVDGVKASVKVTVTKDPTAGKK